ncbi:hypothetical protein DNTS_016349 [Danionella cerebrum]|uniref:Cadherin domain-containing protein n=1 Tax=Danionella cerebrum TaxID=2873325 RepID=A0A553MZE6_9TELE|nr:hypothetical protein DNTS_016349 [Danionella translucida]
MRFQHLLNHYRVKPRPGESESILEIQTLSPRRLHQTARGDERCVKADARWERNRTSSHRERNVGNCENPLHGVIFCSCSSSPALSVMFKGEASRSQSDHIRLAVPPKHRCQHSTEMQRYEASGEQYEQLSRLLFRKSGLYFREIYQGFKAFIVICTDDSSVCWMVWQKWSALNNECLYNEEKSSSALIHTISVVDRDEPQTGHRFYFTLAPEASNNRHFTLWDVKVLEDLHWSGWADGQMGRVLAGVHLWSFQTQCIHQHHINRAPPSFWSFRRSSGRDQRENDYEKTAGIRTQRARFSRQEQSVYLLPILLVDSGPPALSSTGTLTIHVCGCDGTGAILDCNATALAITATLSPGALIAMLVCSLILLGTASRTLPEN